MILSAYIDESGMDGSFPLHVMAGYLATAEQWEKFNHEWKSLLAKYGVKYLHAKKLWSGSKPFNALNPQQRMQLAEEAHNVIMGNVALGFVVILKNEDFKKFKADQEKSQLNLDSRYGVCFRLCISFLPEMLQKIDPTLSSEINIVVESGHTNVGATAELFGQYKKIADPSLANLVKDVTTADKEASYGCQAADLLAWSSLKAENENLAKYQDINIEETQIIITDPVSVFRCPVTPEILDGLKEGQLLLKEYKREYGKRTPLSSASTSKP